MFPKTIISLVLVIAVSVLSKSDPPLGCVRIESVAYRRFMFPGQFQNGYERSVNFDNWERLVDKEWIVEKSGKEYRIYAVKNQIAPMFLYANKTMLITDSSRRYARLSAFVGASSDILWKIEEKKNGYFTIQNKVLKEYLYAGERKYDVSYDCVLSYDTNQHYWRTNSTTCRTVGRVFTWKGKEPKKPGPEFQWKIHSC
ncbi:uncharacterized protein LOC134216974 [Armigeres subalbatus]|uniref:uncharacterized protein LOC134216974 n=1 Tax=Armigeres subalbatus TaxID=124917 RepID=UPI002ED2F8F8